MSVYKASEIFAAVSTAPPPPRSSAPGPGAQNVNKNSHFIASNMYGSREQQHQQHIIEKPISSQHQKTAASQTIQVSATAEQTLQPDRCRITMLVQAVKEAVQDAKNSVSRRLDYIRQTLHKYHIQDNEIVTSRSLRLVDGAYHYDAEVTATFIDHEKCEEVANLLVEKLDGSVKITTPEFFQSPTRLENLRKQTSLTAVKNAKQKAIEMAQFLNASVGKALSISEEESNEWEGNSDRSETVEGPVTIHQRKAMASVTVSVKVTAVFELKPKGKPKESNL